MIINLSDVLTAKLNEIKVAVPFEADSFNSNGIEYKVKEFQPVEFEFIYQSKGKGIIQGKVKAVFDAECDKCLSNTEVTLVFDIERDFVAPDILPEDADDYSFMEGFSINTQVLLEEEILINWPLQILCKEDCKGLCFVCGQNLNIKDCGCDRRIPDIRFAGIIDIFNGER